MATLYDILDNLGGALRIAGNLILQPITRSHYRRWGATDDEVQRTLPGDERVPTPNVITTLAVTIQAPAREVWPWMAQIGQERGGLYSYELLENLARCQMRNADRIVPEWELKVGDQMRMGPPGYPVNQVVALERGRWLLMAGADLKTGIADPLPKLFLSLHGRVHRPSASNAPIWASVKSRMLAPLPKALCHAQILSMAPLKGQRACHPRRERAFEQSSLR